MVWNCSETFTASCYVMQVSGIFCYIHAVLTMMHATLCRVRAEPQMCPKRGTARTRHGVA